MIDRGQAETQRERRHVESVVADDLRTICNELEQAQRQREADYFQATEPRVTRADLRRLQRMIVYICTRLDIRPTREWRNG
jgi:hypothetical protein